MIYTSRYSNPELSSGNYTVVGITRGAPKFPLHYQLAGNIMDIAPPGYLFREYNRERFTPPYFRHMDQVGVDKILQTLKSYEDMGKPVVLCCYEDVRKPGEWCHRLVFAEWWFKRTGEKITELQDPSSNKWEKKAEMERARERIEEESRELEDMQIKMW